MTIAQAAFLIGLTIVIAGIVAFSVVVVVGAARSGQGVFVNASFLSRMMRSSAERVETDRWAFYAHRLSGFAIFAFLCLHVLDVSLYAASTRLYGQVHEIYGNGLMRVLECGLLFAILFHTFNGLRVLVLDFSGVGTVTSRRLLGLGVAATVVLGMAGSVVILRPVFA